MRKQNYSDESNRRRYLLQIAQGGLGVSTQEEAIRLLNGIDKRTLGEPGSIVGLNEERLIPAKFLSGSLGGANVVNIFGALEVGFGESIVLEITNYDVFTEYVIVAKDVSYTQNAETIVVTGIVPSLTGHITINGSKYPITVRAPQDAFRAELRDTYTVPMKGDRYEVSMINGQRAVVGFPDDSRQYSSFGVVQEINGGTVLPDVEYEHPNVVANVSFGQNSTLSIVTDTQNLTITSSGPVTLQKPKFVRLLGAGGTRINTTIYESSIGNGGGPAGAAVGSGTTLASPDYSRVPATVGNFALTVTETETIIGNNTYTKKYTVTYRFINTGALSHHDYYEAQGSFTSTPGYISPAPLSVELEGQTYIWASERVNGTGREVRNVDVNNTRNQMFGEKVAHSADGLIRVYASPRYDYAVPNNGGTVTFFSNNVRTTVISNTSYPHEFFGSKVLVSPQGGNILVASKGRGIIRRFSALNGVISERTSLNYVGGGVGTEFGADMAGNTDRSTVVVLAPKGQSPLMVIRRNTASDQYDLVQSISNLPDIGIPYTIGSRIQLSGNGETLLVQAKVRISDTYSRFIVLVFDRDQNLNYNYSGRYLEDIRSWSPNFNWGEDFQINESGDKIVVGSPGNLRAAGCAHVFLKVSNAWIYYRTLLSPHSDLGDGFGTSVHLPPTTGQNTTTVHVTGTATVNGAKVLEIFNFN